jgi:hypothetical protein
VVAPRRIKLKIPLLVNTTNLISVYLFSRALLFVHVLASVPRIHLWDSGALLHHLNTMRAARGGACAKLAVLRTQCNGSSLLLEPMRARLGVVHGDAIEAKDFVGWSEEPAGELKLAMEPHRLPLGFHPNFGTHELFPLLGFACRSIQDEQGQYTSYDADTQYMSAASALLTTHTGGCSRAAGGAPKKDNEVVVAGKHAWKLEPWDSACGSDRKAAWGKLAS